MLFKKKICESFINEKKREKVKLKKKTKSSMSSSRALLMARTFRWLLAIEDEEEEFWLYRIVFFLPYSKVMFFSFNRKTWKCKEWERERERNVLFFHIIIIINIIGSFFLIYLICVCVCVCRWYVCMMSIFFYFHEHLHYYAIFFISFYHAISIWNTNNIYSSNYRNKKKFFNLYYTDSMW